MKNIADIIAENNRRKLKRLPRPYEPLTGLGCTGTRNKIFIPDHGSLHLPETMVADSSFSPDMNWESLCRLRFHHDFEYWCYTCINITDKMGQGLVPFVLNVPQRKVLCEFEKMRLDNRPIRAIILKARQWGSSTLVQIYMAWIQIIHKEYCNSFSCAQLKDTANVLRAMYERLLDNYPAQYWDGEKAPALKSVTGSRNLYALRGRNCTVALTSSLSPDNARGSDLSMAHLSEVAFWKSSARFQPESVIRAVCASVMIRPLTVVVLESTANGIGNYFHSEWLKASAGLSDKTPIFVAWHEIDIYSCEVKNPQKLWDDMDDYELQLWEEGLTLEQINWYHKKRREYPSRLAMMAEYPSDPVEAFTATNTCVFSQEAVETLRNGCNDAAEVGELAGDALSGPHALSGIHFTPDSHGKLRIWKRPDSSVEMRNRYVVGVDIGGRSEMSDFSVIVVFDRIDPEHPELVAQWRGHIDHDILAWQAAMIAKWYNFATLIIESNTLETDRTEGDHGEFILHELNRHYRNLYCREDDRPGFHTNRATKTRIINTLIAIIRENTYIERDDGALNEYLQFEKKPRGSFGAKSGFHDDMVMARALALSHCKDLYITRLNRLAHSKGMEVLKQ